MLKPYQKPVFYTMCVHIEYVMETLSIFDDSGNETIVSSDEILIRERETEEDAWTHGLW